MNSVNSAGGMPARRAVTRWAWRLFRRDWRQHLLIISLLTFAVAGAVCFSCAVYNIAPADGRADFGDSNYSLQFDEPDPAELQATLDAATATFGTIDAIGHRPLPVPGTATQIDYRVQQPDGAFGAPLLALRTGRYPVGDDEAAVTRWVADTLGAGVGSTIDLDGVERSVVGVVENPSALDDDFVLLSSSALAQSSFVTVLVHGNEDLVQSFRESGQGMLSVSSRGDTPQNVIATILTLVVSTIVLFLVGLIAAASFAVIAQRRLPQMGMMSAVGATEKHLRFTMLATGAVTGIVSSGIGAGIGLLIWTVLAPNMESTVDYRIDVLNVPWYLVIGGMVLAVLAATIAAWWPGRTMARIPTVLALSGRPPRPAALHRSALLAAALLIGGVVSLAIGANAKRSVSTVQLALIAIGTLAVLAGVLLVGPIAIRGVARVASRVPIAARLALRDLSRYQARSGAALAAIALALGIPVAVVASAAAADNNAGAGNLGSDQLLVRPAEVKGPFVPDASTIATMQTGVDALATSLDGASVVPLDAAVNPDARSEPGIPGTPAISLVRSVDEHGWEDLGMVYVATPELLASVGLAPEDVEGEAVLTNQTGSDLALADVSRSRAENNGDFESVAPSTMPDTYTSLPRAVVPPSALDGRGWVAAPSGQWIIRTDAPLTSAELKDARAIATQFGFVVESRETEARLTNLRLGAVGIGMLLALAILAMTVGLIRSESASDLRTLTATGAASRTRRNITATTAGGLAALGALLGIVGAYIALAAGRISNLTPLPVLDLSVIAIGTPLAAAVVGWLLAGREPAVLARRAIA